jgi:hypothetical protein
MIEELTKAQVGRVLGGGRQLITVVLMRLARVQRRDRARLFFTLRMERGSPTGHVSQDTQKFEVRTGIRACETNPVGMVPS